MFDLKKILKCIFLKNVFVGDIRYGDVWSDMWWYRWIVYMYFFKKWKYVFFFKVKTRYGLDMPIGNFSFNNRLGIGGFYFFSKKLFFEKKYLVCVGFLVVFCVFSLLSLARVSCGIFLLLHFFWQQFSNFRISKKRLPSIFCANNNSQGLEEDVDCTRTGSLLQWFPAFANDSFDKFQPPRGWAKKSSGQRECSYLCRQHWWLFYFHRFLTERRLTLYCNSKGSLRREAVNTLLQFKKGSLRQTHAYINF